MTVLVDIGIGPISIPTPGDVVTALTNAVIGVADAVFDKIIEWIAGLLAQAVGKVTEALVTLLSAIKPTLTPGGGITNAAPIQASIAGMAAMLVTIFFVLRIIHGIITGQAGQNLRATIVDAFSDPLITNYATTLNDTVSHQAVLPRRNRARRRVRHHLRPALHHRCGVSLFRVVRRSGRRFRRACRVVRFGASRSRHR